MVEPDCDGSAEFVPRLAAKADRDSRT